MLIIITLVSLSIIGFLFFLFYKEKEKRIKAEEILIKRAETDVILNNITKQFLENNIDSSINYILKELGEFSSSDRSYVFRFSENRNSFSCTHEWCRHGIKPYIQDLQSISLERFKWLIKQLEAGKIINFTKLDQLPEEAFAEKKEFESQQIKSILLIPIKQEGGTVGFIGFDAVKQERHWEDQYIQLLLIIQEIFAIAWERNKTENVLKESEEKYRNLFSIIPDGLAIYDLDSFQILETNQAVSEIYGYTSEELRNLKATEISADPERTALTIQNFKIETPLVLNRYHKRKDGSIFPIHLSIGGFNFKGKRLGVSVIRDISERIKLEESLAKREEWFRSIIENVSDIVQVINKDGLILYSSPSIFRLLGFLPEEVLNTSPYDLAVEEDRPMLSKLFEEVKKKQGATSSITYRIIDKDGNLKYIELNVNNQLYNFAVQGIIASIRDVTERELFEQKTQNALSLNKAVFESTAEGILVLDHDKRIVTFNQNWLRMLGIPFETSYQGKFSVELLEIFSPIIKNKESLLLQIKKIDANPESQGLLEIEFNNGKVFECCAQPQILDGKIIGRVWSLRDETEKKKADEELRKSKERLATALDALKGGVWEWNLIDNISYVDHRFVNILGYSYKEVEAVENKRILRWAFNNIHPEDKDYVLNFTNDFIEKRGDSFQIEFRFKSKNGDFVWTHSYGKAIKDSKGAVIGIAGVNIDITERKRIEETIRQAKEEAEEATKAKSEFLANVSHEIRTPLNVIMGFTEILNENIQNPINKEYINAILASGKGLLQLLNDILDLSKIEAGKLKIQKEAVKLSSLVQEIQSIFSMRTIEKSINFIFEIEEILPNVLSLDEVRLRQILFNLVGNAIKFTEKGHVKLSISKFGGYSSASTLNLIFQVEDTGIGINENQLEIIFESFHQQSGQDSRKFEGTGLGLAITKRLVEMMGGKIFVESEEGKGSKFKVILFDVSIVNSKIVNKQPINHFEESIIFEPCEILLVDDVEINRHLVRNYLESFKISIEEAASGTEAILKAKKTVPKIIFLDIIMPEMDGYEVLQLIRKDNVLKNIPVIALTAQAMKEEQEKIRASGFDDYLAKPLLRKDLVRVLQKFLSYKEVHPLNVEFELDEKLLYNEKDIEDLINWLNEEALVEWNNVIKTFNINKIEAFSHKLVSKAIFFQNNYLLKYGEKLFDEIQSFDMEKLPETLKCFPKIVESLINYRNANSDS